METHGKPTVQAMNKAAFHNQTPKIINSIEKNLFTCSMTFKNLSLSQVVSDCIYVQ